jgi:nucleoside-diphosphate-sugar epimerase
MRVLVTGASGFVGKNILLHKPAGWKVTAVYNTAADFPAFLAEHNIDATVVQCDLTNKTQVAQTFGNETYDACLFLAAHVDPNASFKEPLHDLERNTLSVLNLLQSGVRINRFVYLSSGSVYEGATGLVNAQTPIQPLVPYSIAKYASEQYIKSFVSRGNPGSYIIVRFFGCYGPYEAERKLYRKIVRQFAIEKNPDIELYGDGSNKIYAMYVTDAVAGLIAIVHSDVTNVTVDFCGEEQMTIRQTVERAAKHFSIEPHITSNKTVPAEAHTFSVTNDAMEEYFHFRPTVRFEKALDLYAEWLRHE